MSNDTLRNDTSIYDYTKMKVNDIRQILSEEFQYEEEELLKIKGKSALVETLQKERAKNCLVEIEAAKDADPILGMDEINFGDDEDSGDFIEVNNTSEENELDSENPEIGDFAWHDYVMGHFEDEELIKHNPTVDGMRRVTEKLISGIKSISTNVVQTPTQSTPKDCRNDRRATVIVTVKLNDESSFDGAADCYWGNAEKPFDHYPVSMAETRAEGRALKRALRLRKVNSAEELGGKIDDDLGPTIPVENGFITDTQLRFLDVMCGKDRLNIDVGKFIISMKMDAKNIKALTHSDALVLNKKLSEYQQTEVPTELVGYNTNWRN